MIRTKTPEDIRILAEGGAILARILDELEECVESGVSGAQLDEYARELISQYQVVPSFLGFTGKGRPPYPAAICVSVNEAVVHGLPSGDPFREGDIVGIDVGIVYRKLYVDGARTVPVGSISKDARKLLAVTERALQRAVTAATIGNTTGHIGEAIQSFAEQRGFGVVRQLVGHGVGYDVHEPPQVPNFGRAGEGELLREGLVIAIEPMVTIGDPTVTTAPDKWTVVTKSGGLSAHFEHTVAVTADGPRILTKA